VQTLLTIGDYLLSPFKIERITQVSARAIDNNYFDLYNLSESEVNYISSAYNDKKTINSILLKTNHSNQALIEKIYSQYESEKINFIVSYTKDKKYLLSFLIVESHQNLIEEALHYLKNNQHEIEKWFDTKLAGHSQFSSSSNTIFPEYAIPNIPIKINNTDASLTKLSLTHLYIQIDQMVSFDQSSFIHFNLGAKKFEYEVDNIERVFDNLFCIALIYETQKKLDEWINFTIAMQLRLKKANA